MCGKLLRMIDVHAPATRACHEPLRDRKLYITEKNNWNSGFRIKFLWVARRCHVHSFGFWFTKGYLKIFGGILCDREKSNTRSLALLKTTGRATTLVHPMQAISCEICQIEVDTCFCFVYILLHSDYPYHFK